MSVDTILKDIRDELEGQVNPFEAKHTYSDWTSLILWWVGSGSFVAVPEAQRRYLVKAAAQIVAAVETCDRNGGFAPRHYDSAVADKAQ